MKPPAPTDGSIHDFAQAWPAPKQFHLIGIGGISMSGLAEILLSLGYGVSGSDREASPLTDRLVSLGASMQVGHDVSLVLAADVVVYSAAVAQENPELAAAREQGTLVLSRADLLDGFMRHGKAISVSGTHGKSTTTTMIGLMLLDCGFDPTLIVGAVVPDIGSNVRLGSGEYMAVEADEYSRSFLELSPEIAVVTSVDADHLEYYGNQDAIDDAFLDFIHGTPCYQPVVLCLDDPGVRRLMPRIRRHMITYGCETPATVQASEIQLNGFQSTCSVSVEGNTIGELRLKRPGKYHVQNALAAVSVGHQLGIPAVDMLESLEGFTGLHRRFEIVGRRGGVTIVDDYAHHPAEVEALLSGLAAGTGRVVVVFQPHLYSRTVAFKDEFGQALAQADLVVVTDVYASRENPIADVSGDLIVKSVRDQGHGNVLYVAEKDDVASTLCPLLVPGDLVLTVGAGNITDIGSQILNQISEDGQS